MTWRDNLKTQATFRGVPFQTTDAEARVGRRTVLHEYPLRDRPYTEDMGRRARQYVVEAYVIGDDYLQRRDALMAAIEAAGPGELVHPRYGHVLVAVQDYVSVKESQREGGMARFSITFVEHGSNEFPKAVADSATQVNTSADELVKVSSISFDEAFEVAGSGVTFDQALKDFQADLDAHLKMVRQVTDISALSSTVASVNAISSRLTTLLRTPLTLAQEITGLGTQLSTGVGRPLLALSELARQFGSNPRPTTTALAGSTRARLIANELARADLQRRAALATQARLIAVALDGQDLTAAQARALRDRLLDQMDDELERTDPPVAVASALQRVRGAVVTDVQRRAELLREASTYTPQAVLPALVLAHRIYQDADRADELVARNAVRHPAFVPAGPLEVLL